MPQPRRSISSIPITAPTGPSGVRVAASSGQGASRRTIAHRIRPQSPRYPIPCRSPKSAVSDGYPGAIQKKSSAVNRPSSNQDAIFTQRKRGPGTGLGSGFGCPVAATTPKLAGAAPRHAVGVPGGDGDPVTGGSFVRGRWPARMTRPDRPAYFFAFFALHFWTDVELRVEPSEKDSVAVWDHFFFLHRAMT
jgi:hypothetical protein